MNHTTSFDPSLANVPIFSRLPAKEQRRVRSLFTELHVPTGKALIRQGDFGHEFLVIVSGTATVDRDGVHIGDVGPGDFQGGLSLLDHERRTATVTATSPMTVPVASSQEFTTLLDEEPEIARRMLPTIVHRVRTLPGNA